MHLVARNRAIALVLALWTPPYVLAHVACPSRGMRVVIPTAPGDGFAPIPPAQHHDENERS